MKYHFITLFLLSVSLLVSSCASSARSGAGTVREGEILSINRQIEHANRNLSSNVGGILGSLTGLVVGSGTGRYVASAGGAIGGQIAGSQVAKNVVVGENFYYRIQFPAGDTITVVQAATSSEPRYRVGQIVRVLNTGQDYQIL